MSASHTRARSVPAVGTESKYHDESTRYVSNIASPTRPADYPLIYGAERISGKLSYVSQPSLLAAVSDRTYSVS
jgi:hypothetical protein